MAGDFEVLGRPLAGLAFERLVVDLATGLREAPDTGLAARVDAGDRRDTAALFDEPAFERGAAFTAGRDGPRAGALAAGRAGARLAADFAGRAAVLAARPVVVRVAEARDGFATGRATVLPAGLAFAAAFAGRALVFAAGPRLAGLFAVPRVTGRVPLFP